VELWTVYDRPVDHPRHCAVRKVLIEDDGLSPADGRCSGPSKKRAPRSHGAA